jgi:hypothetical protein
MAQDSDAGIPGEFYGMSYNDMVLPSAWGLVGESRSRLRGHSFGLNGTDSDHSKPIERSKK